MATLLIRTYQRMPLIYVESAVAMLLKNVENVELPGHSIDWASVYVFTCSQTCEIENNGYAKEFACKQDFC
ncbi:hypothetical protein TELCIR_10749 [Teladorsagia circumcincta]|uniref:Programmed cell death protein 2 C-terminal domain-containing protein n=1 Tax=Teladorsagia circumcincta TaxID=45464 RepID=A0A2G9UBD0_TELCI|nr:hypothetical protein TELCIR_10749 [Teladorsagia circumcincta]